MTPQYIKRLIELAKEVQRLSQPCVINGKNKDEAEALVAMNGFEFSGKLHHLLGYILALEEFEMDSISKP